MNTKMKVLSLALVGLCGFAGSAMAAGCPNGPTTTDGGAWTSATELPTHADSPLSIQPGGLDGSACRLDTQLQAGNIAAASSVRYNHAAPEPNYRFQFLVDTHNLSAFNSTTDNVVVFQAPSSTAANGFNRLLRVTLVAGPSGAKRVRFVLQTGSGSFTTGQTFATNLIDGVNRIEGKLTVGAGAAGTFSYWVNAAAGTTEPTPSGTIGNLDNAAWGGVNAANLGLAAPSQSFADNHGAQVVSFDTFDSRRNTYIGH